MGSLYILAAIFLWSSLGVVVKTAGMPLNVLVFYALLVSLMLMGPALAAGGHLSLPRGRPLIGLFIIGPLSLINTMTFFYAFRTTTIANAVLTHYIAPLVVAFLSPLFLKEPLTKRVIVSIAIASAGLYIMLGVRPAALNGLAGRPLASSTAGIISGLVSGFTYAFLIIVLRAYAQSMRPLVICFFQNLAMALMLLPFADVPPLNGLWAIFFMGIVHSTIAPILYVKGMRLVEASRAAILGYIEPVCAIILGLVILGEHPNAASLAGGAMILFSGYLTLKGPRPFGKGPREIPPGIEVNKNAR